ncbi:MAG: hypothetical protein JNK53_07000, partial [Phycisphaerae bacterium]|nr:hypothetical protein [Phycisphaerae bacterium]
QAGALAPLASVAPAFAPAQSDESQNDLRKEIDRLRQEVKALEADLDTALARVRELEALVAKSHSTHAAPPASAPVPMPANPALGPGGLLSTLQADYNSPEAGFAGKDIPNGPGADPNSQKAWTAHQRALESWIAREQRKVSEVQWVGVVDPASVEQRGREVSMTLVFTNGGRDFRAPVTVDQGMVERLRGPDGSITQAPLTVNAVVTPRLRINPNRPDTGAFDNPPLVAPFVEFGYDLKIRVLLPEERAKPAAPKA